MNWGQARSLLRLAQRRAGASPDLPHLTGGEFLLPADRPPASPPTNGHAGSGHVGSVTCRARSLCIASGKGGTGKSALAASLAALFSIRGKTLIVDADLGVGNAHILQGVSPEHSFVDVVEGRMEVGQVVQSCRAGIDLVSGGSGVSRMAGLSSYELHLIACGLEKLEHDYAFVVVDSAAGISDQTITFAHACDQVLIVTTPDLTAMTDAYAFMKVLLGVDPHANVTLVVNRADSPEEGQRTAERICGVSERFLGRAPAFLGTLPEDPAVRRAGNHRAPVVAVEPHAVVSGQLRRLCVRILERLSQGEPRGMGHALVEGSGFSGRFSAAR